MENYYSRIRYKPFVALFLREIRRFLKIIFQTLAAPLINVVLYLLIFGLSIGDQIPLISDVPYVVFLIPGLVMMSTLRNCLDNSAGSVTTAKFCGELEDLRIVPLTSFQIAMGNGLGSLVRGLTVGFLTLIVSLLFFRISYGYFFTIHHPVILFIFLAISGLSFAHLGMGMTMLAKTFDQVSAINTFILIPLIYLGGVFFSLDHLHPFWQTLSQFNPIFYLINGARYSILGFSDISVILCFAVAFLNLIIMHIFALWSLKKGSYQRW